LHESENDAELFQGGIMGQEAIEVSTGQVKAAVEKGILRSTAIGSCIVVAAYNFKNKIGAMAHIMLPGSAPEDTAEKTKYAADAIDELINIMPEAGLEKGDTQVCLVGAANVLEREDDTICEANIESVTNILKEKDIPVRASVIGGTERKSVFLNVQNGCVSCANGDDKEKILWQAGQEQFN